MALEPLGLCVSGSKNQGAALRSRLCVFGPAAFSARHLSSMDIASWLCGSPDWVYAGGKLKRHKRGRVRIVRNQNPSNLWPSLRDAGCSGTDELRWSGYWQGHPKVLENCPADNRDRISAGHSNRRANVNVFAYGTTHRAVLYCGWNCCHKRQAKSKKTSEVCR